MMIGRLIERLFVQVQADLSTLSSELGQGVAQTNRATSQMAKSWEEVDASVRGLQESMRSGLVTQSQYLSGMNKLSSSAVGLAGSYRSAQKEVFGIAAAANAAIPAVERLSDPTPINNFSRSLGNSRNQMLNLGYQVNDIAQTLATGMNPFTVMIQQGSQILQIYGGNGGVRALLSDLGGILLGIGRRLWPIAALAAGLGLLQRELNKTTLVAVSFFDTTRAVFQVLGDYIYPFIQGPLSDLQMGFGKVLDFITESFPKVMNSVISAGMAAVGILGSVWNLLPKLWQDAWAAIKNTAVDAIEYVSNLVIVNLVNNVLVGINRILQAFDFAYEGVKIIWSRLPDILKDAIGGAVNFVVEGAEKMVNVAIDGINKLIAGIQALMDFVGADKALELFGFSGQLKPMDKADLASWRMETGTAVKDAAAELGSLAATSFNKNMLGDFSSLSPIDMSSYKGASTGSFSELGRRVQDVLTKAFSGVDYMGKFFEDVKVQAIENAEARIAAGLEDVAGAAGRAAEEVKTLMGQLDENLTTAAENLSGVFGDAFERIAETGKLTFSSFIQDLNKLVIGSVSDLLQEELSSLFSALVKGKGGLGGGFANLFTRVLGGGTVKAAAVGGRAVGGIEMPWRNFIAGEHGAELIRQDGASGARRISTAGRTKQLMSQGNRPVSVVMNIQTPDVASFQKSQGQIAGRIAGFLGKSRRNE